MDDDRGTAAPAERAHRLDLALFIVYCLAYAGFALLAAFRLDLLATPLLGAVNLAVLYGLALIGLAILFALVASIARRWSRRTP